MLVSHHPQQMSFSHAKSTERKLLWRCRQHRQPSWTPVRCPYIRHWSGSTFAHSRPSLRRYGKTSPSCLLLSDSAVVLEGIPESPSLVPCITIGTTTKTHSRSHHWLCAQGCPCLQ